MASKDGGDGEELPLTEQEVQDPNYFEKRMLLFASLPRPNEFEFDIDYDLHSGDPQAKRLKQEDLDRPGEASVPEKFALTLAMNEEAQYLEHQVKTRLIQFSAQLDDEDEVWAVRPADNNGEDKLRWVQEMAELLADRIDKRAKKTSSRRQKKGK